MKLNGVFYSLRNENLCIVRASPCSSGTIVARMQARDLVLSSQLSSQKLIRFLRRFGFEDPQRADSHLQSIAESWVSGNRWLISATLSSNRSPGPRTPTQPFFISQPISRSLPALLPSCLTFASNLLH